MFVLDALSYCQDNSNNHNNKILCEAKRGVVRGRVTVLCWQGALARSNKKGQVVIDDDVVGPLEQVRYGTICKV